MREIVAMTGVVTLAGLLLGLQLCSVSAAEAESIDVDADV